MREHVINMHGISNRELKGDQRQPDTRETAPPGISNRELKESQLPPHTLIDTWPTASQIEN